MAVIYGTPRNFKALYLTVLTTLYENTGDVDEHVLSSVGLTSRTYDRRNYILTGSFKVSYTGSDYPDDIFNSISAIELPMEDYRPVDRFKITALEDNTSCICIMPIGRRRQVQHKFMPLVKGTPFTAERGGLYVPDVGFTITDLAVPAGTVIDCSDTDKSIVPNEDGIITMYFIVEKGE